jgi:hypothetical protein
MNLACWRRLRWSHALRVLGLTILACAVPGLGIASPACVDMPGGIGGRGSPAHGGGIGGTGAPTPEGGIGGTGAAPQPQGGGIGGTGDLATERSGGVGGTGIVGTITGFASVCVNGIEVHYAPTTPVSVNGHPADARTLAVGQVVAIDAEPGARGLAARSIAVLDAVHGPITHVGPEGIGVMGQSVKVTGATRVAGADGRPAAVSSLQPGTWVRVSGHRNSGGEVIATRLEESRTGATASTIGDLQFSGPLGQTLYGTPVSGLPQSMPIRAHLLISGRWDGHQLRVDAVRLDPDLPFAGKARQMSLEGFVQARSSPESLTVGAFTVVTSSSTQWIGGDREQLREGRPVQVFGTLSGPREIRAERFVVERPMIPRTGDSSRFGRGGREGKGKGDADDLGERHESAERVEQNERSEKVERAEKAERPEKAEGSEKVERPTKVERSTRVERVDKIERPAFERRGR